MFGNGLFQRKTPGQKPMGRRWEMKNNNDITKKGKVKKKARLRSTMVMYESAGWFPSLSATSWLHFHPLLDGCGRLLGA